MTGEVEVTSPTTVPTLAAVPESRWFTDGVLLRRKLGGTAPVAVAALGTRRSATLPGIGEVRSQLYEVRRDGQRWLGSVVTVGSKVVCTGADRIESTGVRKEMTALLQRCPLPDGMMPGIVHVVAGPASDRYR